jgi:DNA-binding transcriptional ArsR family regulator
MAAHSVGAQGQPDELKASLFKGMAHPVRVCVLEILAEQPATAVTEILARTGIEASLLSQHLSVLRRHNLVVSERRGSQVFYQLSYPCIADLLATAKVLLLDILKTNQRRLQDYGQPTRGGL